MSERDRAEREAELAAAEAAAIGGRTSSEPPPVDGEPDEATRPLVEAGEGESEGFEEAERELAEHSSHGDEHAAFQVIEDAIDDGEEEDRAVAGEADHEYSTELEEDER